MFKTEIVKLTPELAGNLLANNSINRPVSKATIDRYERAIKRGEWALNGEPIIVFANGDLGDGQHRCIAVKKTGIPIDTVIMYGIDPSTFGTLNGGKPRSSSDILAINGEANAHILSAAARAFLLSQLTGRDGNCITSLQIEKCVEDHPHLRYWTQKYCAAKKAKLIPSALCGYMAIASEKYGFEKLDKFFEQLSTGVDLAEGDPAFVLRERFIAQTKVSRISNNHAKAFIVKAINAHVLGKKLKFLRFSEGEPIPKII
jgi:hypothetical protein